MPKFILAMIKMFDQWREKSVITEPSFFKSLFGAPELLKTQTVSLDRVQTNLRVAKQVVPGQGRHLNDYGKYMTESFPIPEYNEGISINAFDGFLRSPGENPFNNGVDPVARVVAKSNEAQQKLFPKFMRAEELMAASAIINASITLDIPLKNDVTDDTVLTIDYGRDAALSATASGAWSTVATDIIGDVESMAQNVVDLGYATPDIVVMSKTDYQNFLNNTAVKARLNLLRLDNGSIGMPQLRDTGGVYHGTFSFGSFNLEIWTYDAKYANASGTLTRYLPIDRVLVGAVGARRDLVYAPSPMFKQVSGIGEIAVPVQGQYHPYLVADQNSTANISGIKSRPLYIPVAVNTFGVIDTTP